jgi:hypothetical protein
LILQAVDYVEGNIDTPPYELRYAYYIKNWGMPDNWLQWPAGLIHRMNVLYQYAQAFTYYRLYSSRKGWVDSNPHIFEMVTNVWKIRKEFGLDFMTGKPKS